MKRTRVFICILVVMMVAMIGMTSAFAVTRTAHSDSYKTTKATGSLTLTRCCTSSGASLDSYLKVRGTQRLILYPDSNTSYVYGTSSGNKTSLSATASVSSDSYAMYGSAHACYSKCPNCASTFGSKTSYH